MKLRKIMTLAIAAGSVTGCLHRYENTLNSWIGHDINELITQAGPPSSTFEMSDGHVMYTWSESLGAKAFMIGNTAYAVDQGCVTTILVRPTGKIESWQYRGNAC